MVQNDMLTLGLRMFKTLINNVFNVVASFAEYRGSEFCSGLLFGKAGSNLVLDLGRDILEGMDNFDQYMMAKVKS